MVEQPSGRVTFVFTDIEGSTRLLDELGQETYLEALARHREIVRLAFGRHHGYEVDYEGDAFFYAFASADKAVRAVSEAMAGLRDGPIQIRVGVHTGEPGLDPPKYVGMDVHRAARIMAAGHGGQVLLSETTRRQLDDAPILRDLGEHRLKDLGPPVRVYQLGEGEFRPLKVLYRSTLPVQPSALVGRQRELEEAGAFLRDNRVVTLTGPGGSGKTRLALQIAAEAADAFVDGVYWVPLQALTDAELVPSAIAQALEATGDPAEHIADKRLLLVLDNLEQLLAAAPELAELLAACPNLKLLATSRETLRIAGEREYAVDPLALDDAAALFRERAAQPEPLTAVRAICRRLDCLPLAIELAAARTGLLAPDRLLARLEQALPVLTGGRRDAPKRQQTLRATIAWSYELLIPEEQQLFRRLAVFAGSFDLEAAEEVAAAELDALQSLIDKNLVRRWHSGRYGMLETIHEYARERLIAAGAAEALGQRHAHYFAAVSEVIRDGFVGERDARWLDRFDHEQENFRTALAWADERDPVLLTQLAARLTRFWWLRSSITEGRRWLEGGLAACEDPRLRSVLLDAIAEFARREQDFERARSACDEATLLYASLNERSGVGRLLRKRADIERAQGHLNEAAQLYDQSIATLRGLGEDYELAASLSNLADCLLASGETQRAIDALREVLGTSGDREVAAVAHLNLATAALLSEHPEDARRHLEEGVRLSRDLRSTALLGACLELWGAVAAMELDAGRAARLLGAAEQVREEVGLPREPLEQQIRERTLVALASQLGQSALDAAIEEGRALGLERALNEAQGDTYDARTATLS